MDIITAMHEPHKLIYCIYGTHRSICIIISICITMQLTAWNNQLNNYVHVSEVLLFGLRPSTRPVVVNNVISIEKPKKKSYRNQTSLNNSSENCWTQLVFILIISLLLILVYAPLLVTIQMTWNQPTGAKSMSLYWVANDRINIILYML